MNLRHLSDEKLLRQIHELSVDEKKLLTEILHHLREIQDRRLYAKLKYPSLYEYAVKELKYSHGQAARRIQAMRLMVAIPEVELKIASGELTLTNISIVQSSYVKSGRTLDRRDLLTKVENKSSREALEIAGIAKNLELTVDKIHNPELRRKAIAVVGKYAHRKLTFEAILHKLLDEELDGDACENCGSTYALEWDHIVPKAKGGSDDLSNLRRLCRSCNQRAAIVHFGLDKMRQHFHPY